MADNDSVPRTPIELEPPEPSRAVTTAPLPVAVASEPATLATHDRRAATLARVGLLGIAAAALVAAAVLAFGSSLAPARTLAGNDATGAGGADGPPGGIDDLGRLGGHAFGGAGLAFGGVTIMAINGNDIALETEDGWTRTITVDDGTTYSKSGDDIALGDLAVGDRIAFRQTREDDGSWTIDAIAVILPHVGGRVTAVEGSTITVEGRDGETATITVNGDTSYQVNNDAATLGDVEVGMVLVAEGPASADGSITASRVKAYDADGFFGRPGDGPGRRGFGFGFGFGPGFDWPADGPSSTAAPGGGAGAS